MGGERPAVVQAGETALLSRVGSRPQPGSRILQGHSYSEVASHSRRAVRAGGTSVLIAPVEPGGPERESDCSRSHSKLVAREVPEPRSPCEQTYHLIVTYTTLPSEDRNASKMSGFSEQARFPKEEE